MNACGAGHRRVELILVGIYRRVTMIVQVERIRGPQAIDPIIGNRHALCAGRVVRQAKANVTDISRIVSVGLRSLKCVVVVIRA